MCVLGKESNKVTSKNMLAMSICVRKFTESGFEQGDEMC